MAKDETQNFWEDDQQQQRPPGRQRSWFGRNWFWLIPLGCLTPILCCGGGIVLLFGMLKSSGAYTQSLERVQQHPQVKKALGEPIEPAFLVMGSVQLNNDNGNADLTYDVSGPKDSGTVHVVADKRAGVWTLRTLVVSVHGTKRQIDLLAEQRKPVDAPRP